MPDKPTEEWIQAADVAESYYSMAHQPRSCWTTEYNNFAPSSRRRPSEHLSVFFVFFVLINYTCPLAYPKLVCVLKRASTFNTHLDLDAASSDAAPSAGVREATVVLVFITFVDHLDQIVVHQDAACHGLVALTMVLAGAEHCEESRTITQRHAVGVCLMGADNIREVVRGQKVIYSLVAEADGTSSSRGLTKAVGAGSNTLASGIRPDAITRYLLHPLLLVLVARHDGGHLGQGHDRLDLAGKATDRTRDATVDAEDVMVDHSSHGKAVEGLVALLPDLVSELRAEAVLALSDKGLLGIVFLPSVDVPRLVVTT